MAKTNKNSAPKKSTKTASPFGGKKIEVKSTEKIKGRRPLHPNFREITVVNTDKTEFKIFSTYKKDVMHLEVDRSTHPAWNQSKRFVANSRAKNVAKFNSVFGGSYNKLSRKTENENDSSAS